MKKIIFLLVVIGGVIASSSANSLPRQVFIFIIALGGFLLGMSVIFSSCVYGGKVWNIKIPYSKNGKIIKAISCFGLILGGYSAVTTIIAILHSVAGFNLIKTIIYPVVFFVFLSAGPFIAKKITEVYLVSKSENAMILDELELFKEIQENIHDANSFIVGFEGIALFSSTNYCYAVYKYEDYQLGELTSPEEVALVGTYFVQKYHENYTFKVDMAVIPGEPGKTVIAFGTGGIGIARIQGTPDIRIFRSYIFTKK